MIYKFTDETKINSNLEFELVENKLNIFAEDNHSENHVSIDLSKDDVFKLIGALHCIQKEMK